MSKLADQLNKVLPALINPDQVGFVKQTQTRDGTHRILDLIIFAQSDPTDSILLSFNAKNAFDGINWTYLTMVLQKFGFVGLILQAIIF